MDLLNGAEKKNLQVHFTPTGWSSAVLKQGCQIFLGKTIQNVKNIPNDHKMYQIVIKYTIWPLYTYVDKMAIKIPTFSIARPSKI
jgi:hypothetical protein